MVAYMTTTECEHGSVVAVNQCDDRCLDCGLIAPITYGDGGFGPCDF